MVGPIVIVVVIILIPVAVVMSLMILAGVLGHFLTKDVDERFEGSEHLQLR